jgi:hypothetical protein
LNSDRTLNHLPNSITFEEIRINYDNFNTRDFKQFRINLNLFIDLFNRKKDEEYYNSNYEFIEDFEFKVDWNFTEFSKNLNLPIDFVENNINLRWNFIVLLKNPLFNISTFSKVNYILERFKEDSY